MKSNILNKYKTTIVKMDAPPSYQPICKQLAEANSLLQKTIADNKAKDLRLYIAEEAMKTYQRAYHRISTQECIQEEKIRRLEGRL